MDLSKALNPDLILLDPPVSDKWALLEMMTKTILASPRTKGYSPEVREAMLESVLEREHERSTGLGNGFAFPHARIPGLEGFCMCLAILPKGLDFDAIDHKPVQVACMVFTPLENPQIALKLMACVAGLMNDEAVRSFFLTQDSSEKIYAYIQKRHPNVELSIHAEDIMRRPYKVILADTPLREVSHAMLEHNLEAVPVVDDNYCVIGEITCDCLFQRGIPDFFNQLNSVSFVRDFDPFEKYFASEVKLCAHDVMNPRVCQMERDATLLELVFALSVHKYPKIYIQQDGKLIGIIDRIAVLDRILNL